MKQQPTNNTRSKVIFGMLVLCFLAITIAGSAQKAYKVTLLQPTAGQNIIKAQMYTVKFRIKNTGTMAISSMDTIGAMCMVGSDMAMMAGGMYQINPGDSMDLVINNFSYSNFSANMNNVQFCLSVEVLGNTNPNPANSTGCNSVNLKTSATGISEENTTSSINLFPNPANTSINIRSMENVNGSVVLFDLSGKKVNETLINGNEAIINTADYSEGVYLYRITDKSGALIKNGQVTINH